MRAFRGFESLLLRQDGVEIAQVSIRDRVASVASLVKELKAFIRANINAGATVQIAVKLTGKDLGIYGPNGDYRLEHGEFEIFVGASSAETQEHTIHLSAEQLAAFFLTRMSRRKPSLKRTWAIASNVELGRNIYLQHKAA
ncbi:MAG: fibronectin type III-like domain-contianing protein [Pseudomonadota bacterium]